MIENIVTCISEYRWGLDWWIDLLAPYTVNTYANADLHSLQFIVTH
jgi:hypothetical protein